MLFVWLAWLVSEANCISFDLSLFLGSVIDEEDDEDSCESFEFEIFNTSDEEDEDDLEPICVAVVAADDEQDVVDVGEKALFVLLLLWSIIGVLIASLQLIFGRMLEAGWMEFDFSRLLSDILNAK